MKRGEQEVGTQLQPISGILLQETAANAQLPKQASE